MIDGSNILKRPEVSFITCVSDWQLYEQSVVASLDQMSSPGKLFERIPIDNSDNRFSASRALNLGLKQSKGNLIVFCHQDIVFSRNW